MSQTISSHWGIAEHDFNCKTPAELIENLCICRKFRANYLLNTGPTATGAISKYDTAVLEVLGKWVRMCGDVLYEGRGCEVKGSGPDFALEYNDRIYLFIHNLGSAGNANILLTKSGVGAGPRSFTGLKKKISSVRWLDNGEELTFCQDISNGLFTVEATSCPYGSDWIVRVIELS